MVNLVIVILIIIYVVDLASSYAKMLLQLLFNDEQT